MMNKDKKINIRLTEQEYQDIEAKAKEFNMSISAYIRMVALKAKIEIGI